LAAGAEDKVDGVDIAKGRDSLPLALGFFSAAGSLVSDFAVVLDKARVGVAGILFLETSSVSFLSRSYDEDPCKSEFKRECVGVLGVVVGQERLGLEK